MPPFEVRRSRLHSLLMLAGALALFALTLANLWLRLGEGEGLLPAVLLVALMGFYSWQMLMQFRDDQPLVVVDEDGLSLPGVTPQAIPWSRIWTVQAQGGLKGSRVVLALDAPSFDSLRLGHRWMGDAIVKARHPPSSIAIHVGGLDRGRDEIYAAIRRHWPAAAADAEADAEEA